jgi:hypothetical protein
MVIIENGKVKILNLIRRLEFFRTSEQRQTSLTIIPFPMVTMVTRGIILLDKNSVRVIHEK